MIAIGPVREIFPRLKEKIKAGIIPFAVVAISTVLAVLGADTGLRIFGEKLFYYRPHEMFINRWPKLPLISRYKKDVRYEGETYGDLAAMLGDASFRIKRRVVFETDSFGFSNSREVRDEDVYDVIVLGDSFGVGLETTQSRTWVAQLRERYDARPYNLSIPGSPWQSYVNFALEADRLRVDAGALVLVTLFSGNDLDDDYYEGGKTDLAELPWNDGWGALGVRAGSFVRRSPIVMLAEKLRLGNRSAPQVLARQLPDGRSVLFYEPYVISRDRTRSMAFGHANYPALVNTIRGIQKAAAAHGLQTVVVLFPAKEEVYDWVVDGRRPWDQAKRQGGLGEALAESCRENGLRFVDLAPFLTEAAEKEWNDSGDLIYWPDDTHWNEKGHAVVADIIHEVVFPKSAGP
ncbi:MAG: GDSL-type esterase/lipase family protein [Thermodesulfobacteriota bacterium]